MPTVSFRALVAGCCIALAAPSALAATFLDVEVPPPRVYYPAYAPRPAYVHYDGHRHGRDNDHDLIKWIGGAIVLGEIIHHTVVH